MVSLSVRLTAYWCIRITPRHEYNSELLFGQCKHSSTLSFWNSSPVCLLVVQRLTKYESHRKFYHFPSDFTPKLLFGFASWDKIFNSQHCNLITHTSIFLIMTILRKNFHVAHDKSYRKHQNSQVWIIVADSHNAVVRKIILSIVEYILQRLSLLR